MVYNGSLLQVFSQLFHHLARTTYYTLSTDVSSFHDIGSLVTETVICIPGQYAIRGTRGQGFVISSLLFLPFRANDELPVRSARVWMDAIAW